jgi:uncharacterized protein (TIGR02391 family)
MTKAWTLTGEEILALPLDELALRLLVDVDANQNMPNKASWMNQAQKHYGSMTAPMQAMAEAWNWLESRGLVATNFSQSSSDWVFITRLGRKVLEEGLQPLRALDRIQIGLHAELEREVRPQFLLGKYDLAVFAAFKAVEVRVRQLSMASSSDIGVKLMRAAFGEKGPLTDKEADRGERVAMMDLFAGAIGLFKNPTSHRVVEFDDPTQAAEAIFLADLLMRILDSLM